VSENKRRRALVLRRFKCGRNFQPKPKKNTESPITITEGTNQLVPLDSKSIIDHTMRILNGDIKQGSIPKYWDGNTAERVVALVNWSLTLYIKNT
jgi:UDP-N-acetylglucosamine 2-epimerase